MPTFDRETLAAQGTHIVLLYNDEQELVRAIGEYATRVLADGASVVLLASRRHLAAASEWIALSCEREDGSRPVSRYVAIDADAVAERVIDAAEPSAALEEILDDAREHLPSDPAGSALVYIFGDLVGTLWERGEVGRATSIEELGGRMARERGMSVLCAYPAAAVHSEHDVDLVDACHSAVMATPLVPGTQTPTPARTFAAGADPECSRVFPAVVPSCRAARRFVRGNLESTSTSEELVDAVELICSELAANAVSHAHSVFTVALAHSPTLVRISVVDEATVRDEPADYPVRTGRGLGIVAALAREWGIEGGVAGHAVWAEVGERAGGAASH